MFLDASRHYHRRCPLSSPLSPVTPFFCICMYFSPTPVSFTPHCLLPFLTHLSFLPSHLHQYHVAFFSLLFYLYLLPFSFPSILAFLTTSLYPLSPLLYSPLPPLTHYFSIHLFFTPLPCCPCFPRPFIACYLSPLISLKVAGFFRASRFGVFGLSSSSRVWAPSPLLRNPPSRVLR